MRLKLLKKEWTLAMHPAAYIMLGLCVLVLIPNYPFGVSFFYGALGVFFICQSARENHDVTFTLTLPVAKRDAVTGRFLLATTYELLSLLLAAGMTVVHNALIHTQNGAGMEANLVLLGEGFFFYGVFNLLFFPLHYKDVSRVGVPFLISSGAMFILIALDVVLSYALPLWRDVLDTPDPEHLRVKLLFLLLCVGLYVAMTFIARKVSQKRFVKLDIR